MSLTKKLYIPGVLGDSWSQSSQYICEEIPVHTDVTHIIHLSFSVKLLKKMIVLAMDLSSSYPGFYPPPSGLPLVLFTLSATASDSCNGHNQDSLLPLILQQQIF